MLGRGLTHQGYDAGKDADGHCTIRHAFYDDTSDVQASAAGNMIAVHASKLPANGVFMLAIATTEAESSVNPAPASTYTEGAYEYLKLGRTVRKSLRVLDKGTIDFPPRVP
jgi:hypothetical protein